MTTVFYGLDANDLHFPEMIHGEQTDNKRGLDYLRHYADPHGAQVQVLKTGSLTGTIDGHDPLYVLYRVSQGKTKIRLLTITVNWGRGYDPGEFKRNVLNVVEFSGNYDHVVMFVQELDEGDPALEHKVFASCLEPGTKRVGWGTHEPIVFSPAFKLVPRSARVVLTMAAGSNLHPPAPANTGPNRFSVTCRAKVGDIEIAFGNTHPHRNIPNKSVQAARHRGERIFRAELLAQSVAS